MVVVLPVLVMIVAVAFLAVVVMVVMLMVMVVVMTAACAVGTVLMVMIMVVLVVMVVVVASAGAVRTVLMVMVVVVMVVGRAVLVDVHHYSGILERVQGPVLELVVVHVEDSCHETELDGLAGPDLPVEEHTLVDVGEVHGHRLVAVGDGHLDVSHERSGLPLDPPSDLHEDVGQPCLHVRIESADLPVEPYGLAVGKLSGIELTHG